MAERVLVTGGTGYVGAWCIAELLKRGYAVRTSVRNLAAAPRVRAAIAKEAGEADGLEFCVADLVSDEGWDAAMAGCAFVLHVASPLGGATSRDRHALLAPARDGTLRVLQAAVQAGVRRVVMTSAAAAARAPLATRRVSDESVWADPNDPQFDAYRVSKILAERAAWDFIKQSGAKTELTTILPGAVFGPALMAENLGSLRIIKGLLRGQPPRVPRIGFWVVDVRDLVDLHIRAMIAPDASGERFIAAGAFMWMHDVARTLRAELGERGAQAPSAIAPDLAVRFAALFTPGLRSLTPMLGRKFEQTSQKAQRVLGFAPRPAAETIVASAESLLAFAA